VKRSLRERGESMPRDLEQLMLLTNLRIDVDRASVWLEEAFREAGPGAARTASPASVRMLRRKIADALRRADELLAYVGGSDDLGEPPGDPPDEEGALR
jgi:hypothetical protein